MGLDDLLISTGVDALIKLVRERGRIEIRQAAVALHLPLQTVEDWSHVLEGEGLVRIEYQLTNVILVWVQPGGEEVRKRSQAVGRKKNEAVQKIEAIQRSVEQSQADLGALQEQMKLTKEKTGEQTSKLAADLQEAGRLSAQAGEMLGAKQAQIKAMQDEAVSVRAELAEFEKALKELPGRSGNPALKAEMKQLAETEDRLHEKMQAASGVFEAVNKEIRTLQDRLDSDHTMEEITQLKGAFSDLEFSRAEMAKTAQTILHETQMMDGEIGKLQARLKEVETRKEATFHPRKMLEQVNTVAKTVEKERSAVVGDLEKNLEAVRKQVQAYSQAQYQYQTITTRIEALRTQLTKQGEDLTELSGALASASAVYTKDLSDAQARLEEQQAKYTKLEEKAKQVEFVLGHLEELKVEGDALTAKLNGILKEAKFISSLAPEGMKMESAGGAGGRKKGSMVAGGAGGAGGMAGGASSSGGAAGGESDTSREAVREAEAAVTGAASALGTGEVNTPKRGATGLEGLPPELVQRIAITTAEEEEFERKREELGFLIRKMWEDDRKGSRNG